MTFNKLSVYLNPSFFLPNLKLGQRATIKLKALCRKIKITPLTEHILGKFVAKEWISVSVIFCYMSSNLILSSPPMRHHKAEVHPVEQS